jgi:ABC-2 type transport system permease protein
MLAYTRFEITRTFRNVRYLAISLGLPVLLYLLFNQIYSKAGSPGGVGTYFLVGMACFSMITSAISANGGTLPAERTGGWLRQLRTTPLSGTGFIVAKVVLATAVVIPGLAAVSLAAILVGHVDMSIAQWAGFIALVLAGSIPFGFIGLLIGQLLDTQSAQPVQGILSMLLSFGGGLFFPMSLFPDALQSVARVLPTHLLFAIGQNLVSKQLADLSDVAGLAAWAVGLGAVALALWFQQGARRLATA